MNKSIGKRDKSHHYQNQIESVHNKALDNSSYF